MTKGNILVNKTGKNELGIILDNGDESDCVDEDHPEDSEYESSQSKSMEITPIPSTYLKSHLDSGKWISSKNLSRYSMKRSQFMVAR